MGRIPEFWWPYLDLCKFYIFPQEAFLVCCSRDLSEMHSKEKYSVAICACSGPQMT